jgi:hypothetical protein
MRVQDLIGDAAFEAINDLLEELGHDPSTMTLGEVRTVIRNGLDHHQKMTGAFTPEQALTTSAPDLDKANRRWLRPVVWLVVTDRLGVDPISSFFDPNLADAWAQEVGGVVTALPVETDWRPTE